eukprot:scaffold585_cov330-Pavlova_lutheri.AAC.33
MKYQGCGLPYFKLNGRQVDEFRSSLLKELPSCILGHHDVRHLGSRSSTWGCLGCEPPRQCLVSSIMVIPRTKFGFYPIGLVPTNSHVTACVWKSSLVQRRGSPPPKGFRLRYLVIAIFQS